MVMNDDQAVVFRVGRKIIIIINTCKIALMRKYLAALSILMRLLDMGERVQKDRWKF